MPQLATHGSRKIALGLRVQ